LQTPQAEQGVEDRTGQDVLATPLLLMIPLLFTGGAAFGYFLVALGVIFLLANLGAFRIVRLDLVWPLVAAVTLLPLLPRVVRDKQLVALAVVPLVAGVLISAAPMLVYLERNPLELAGHASAMAIWSRDVQQHEESGYHLQHGDTASLWRIQIQRSLGAFVSQSDTQEDYRSERGLLDPVAAVAFVLGLAVLVARWRSLSTLLLGTWIVATLFLGSVIIEDPPQATKLLVLMPAVCLVAGIGLEQLLRGLAPTKPPHFTAIIGIICIVVGAGFGFSYYFGRYQLLPGQTTTVLARYIGSVQTQRPVYLVNLASVPPGNETIGYLAPHATVLAWDTRKATPAVSVNRPLAFIMPDSGAEGDQAWTTVRRTFPSGEERFLSDSNGRPVLRVWEVPPNSTKVG